MREPLARRRATRLIIALLALALLTAACGDEASTDAADSGAGAVDDGAMDDDEMAEMEDDGGHEHHAGPIEVPEGMAVPAISLTAEEDSTSGFNLFIELEDFTVAPENASTDPVDGEGHLHLYIDGERVMRFYNTALQISGLEEGEHEIEVEVSANNHSAYAVDGEPIRASTTVEFGEATHGHADHPTIEVDATSAPEVALEATADPKSGWNLNVELNNFSITPESVGGDHVDGEGHLHLYVDGERITRLYGPWWHLAELTEGSHEVMVELSGNGHGVYAVDGEPIVATTTIEVSADQASPEAGGSTDHDAMDDDEMETMDDAEDLAITASVTSGNVETSDDRVEVGLGTMVTITVDADVDDEVHIHGYDILADVGPDTAAEITFVADVPGLFEVELEDSGVLLFEIAVS